MKTILLIMLSFISTQVFSETAKFCDEIKRFRIWASGSDTNGIWVEFEANPESCPGGFFLRHEDTNKSHAMSFLLAEKAQGNKICIQAVTSSMISNRCRINYVYNP